MECRKNDQTDCDKCPYPHTPPSRRSSPIRQLSLGLESKTSSDAPTGLYIEEYGYIPVINGDPKWLPQRVRAFISEKVRLMRPCNIHICNGSVFEAELLTNILVKRGVLEKLSAYDNVYLARTDPSDTARVEKNTFICTAKREQVEAKRNSAKPCEFAHWISSLELSNELDFRFPGCMVGRTMYVIPFSMGPIAGQFSKNAVQLTDSPYVVLNMRIMTRVSSSVWDSIGTGDFIRCIHSVGLPRPWLRPLIKDWYCNTKNIIIAHRLPENEVWSFGSGYGGNSLLGKKCLALRIASFIGKKEGWLAEHAAILSITDPNNVEIFVCASFPSGSGKTALSTIKPSLPGWKVRVLGDDIAWLRWTQDGQLYAMAPENGMFGIAADVKQKTGENIIKMISANALIVNSASTSKGKFCWQGIEDSLQPDEKVIDWKGNPWKPGDKSTPAHPNSRFTAYTSQCPNYHPSYDSPIGVPISAYIFGTRRPDEMPLIYESVSWCHGVTMAAGMRTLVGNVSDKKSDQLQHDPMSMRPFLSYNFAHYIDHWISMPREGRRLPKIFHVNWYQPGSDGNPIWPGYGENIRVLEWITQRCKIPSAVEAIETPIGFVPKSLNMQGLALDITPLLTVRKKFWTAELTILSDFFDAEMSSEIPPPLQRVLAEMKQKVAEMPD